MSNRLAVVVLTVISSAALQAGSITSVVVYGDSLSDNGNLYAATRQPGAPYFDGRRSNGPVAVEQLATGLGAQLVDYAWIGATTGKGNYSDHGTPTTFGTDGLPGMLTEYNNSKQSLAPYLGGLFVVWGGPNDFLSPSPLDTTPQQIIGRAVSDIVTIVDGLRSQGARDILVPGMPDLGLTPYLRSLGPTAAAEGTQVTNAFNAALVAQLPAGVQYLDTAAFLRTLVADPSAYGFRDVTDPCYNGTTVCADPGQYLFFDDLHPTTQADALLAQQFRQAVVPEPRSVLLIAIAALAFATFRRGPATRRRERA